MFGLIKKIFIGLLTDLVNGSNHTKCIFLSNQKYKIQPTLINLHPNEYSQELHYYLFTVKSDGCVGSCNNLNDLSNKVCVPNKTGNLKAYFKVLTRHISCECKCKFDGKKCNSNQKWNNNKYQC